jgi:hypothetical protein
LASLFGKALTTITEYIQNVFKEGELNEEVICRNFRLTTQHGAIEGKTQEISVKHYNLDLIISVGYLVKSQLCKQLGIKKDFKKITLSHSIYYKLFLT